MKGILKMNLQIAPLKLNAMPNRLGFSSQKTCKIDDMEQFSRLEAGDRVTLGLLAPTGQKEGFQLKKGVVVDSRIDASLPHFDIGECTVLGADGEKHRSCLMFSSTGEKVGKEFILITKKLQKALRLR